MCFWFGFGQKFLPDMSIKSSILITLKERSDEQEVYFNIHFSRMQDKGKASRKTTKGWRNVYPKNVLKQGRNVVIF